MGEVGERDEQEQALEQRMDGFHDFGVDGLKKMVSVNAHMACETSNPSKEEFQEKNHIHLV